jgi:hypothetical protein
MTPEQHMAKAARYEATRSKLDPVKDFELFVLCSVHAGAHLLNAVYHRLDVTSPEFDMVHTFVPALGKEPPEELRSFVSTLKAIEDLNRILVRTAAAWTGATIRKCTDDYAFLSRTAADVMRSGERV